MGTWNTYTERGGGGVMEKRRVVDRGDMHALTHRVVSGCCDVDLSFLP